MMCDLAKAPYRPAALGGRPARPQGPRARRVGLRRPRRPPPARSPGRRWRRLSITARSSAPSPVATAGSAVRTPSTPTSIHLPSSTAGWVGLVLLRLSGGGGAVDLMAALRGYPTGRALVASSSPSASTSCSASSESEPAPRRRMDGLLSSRRTGGQAIAEGRQPRDKAGGLAEEGKPPPAEDR